MKYVDKIYDFYTVFCLILTISMDMTCVNGSKNDFGAPTLPKAGRNDQRQDSKVQLRRWHANNGFHRDLSTEIQLEALQSSSYKDCVFLLIETLHSGVYVDLDQLFDLAQWGGPKVLSAKTIDIEKPEYLSPEHTVYVFFSGSVQSHLLKAQVTVPIHFRYHRPSDRRPNAEVVLRRPRVLARCADTSLSGLGVEVLAPCRHTNDSLCSWTDLSYDIKEGALLAFSVPVGIKGHTTVVAVGTVLLTTLGALSILHTMFKYPDEQVQK